MRHVRGLRPLFFIKVLKLQLRLPFLWKTNLPLTYGYIEYFPMWVRRTFLDTAIYLSPPLIVPLSSPFACSQPSSTSTSPRSAELAFTGSTQLSRWRFCRRASRSRSGRSDPRRSRVSRCCPSGPAAPWPQCGSLGPSPAPGFSADRHIGLGHLPRRDSPTISDWGKTLQVKLCYNWHTGEQKLCPKWHASVLNTWYFECISVQCIQTETCGKILCTIRALKTNQNLWVWNNGHFTPSVEVT